MKKVDVVRAWRNRDYRETLSSAERAALPQNPAGVASLDDDALRSITGGCGNTVSCACCGGGPGPGGGGPGGATTPLMSCTQPGQACP